jgi:hypothetical protein
MKFSLKRVEFMPANLEPGIVYFAEEYGAAAHLCACGCRTKIRTPIAPTEWSLQDSPRGVSLCPSIGNWQHPCRSHYWITDGAARWSGQWSDQQIRAGRAREATRREQYFEQARTRRWWRFIPALWRRVFK